MEKKQRRVTCSDVARVSGVSRATVSYVLNNDPKQTISAETRKRVLNAAQELGYQPLAAARTLRIGHSNLVLAVVAFEQIDPRIAGDLKYIEDGLAKYGFTLIWHVGTHNLPELRHPSANITPAVILSFADHNDPAVATFLHKFNAPILSMSVTDFGKSVGETQAKYLIQHGYQNIVYVTTDRRDIQSLSKNRLEGVRQACAEFEVKPPFEQTIPFRHDDCRDAIQNLLVHQSPPFGICCYNDEVAFAVISALNENEIKIPDSVAVIGCDDLPLAQFSVPALTTIAFQNYQFLDQTIENILAVSRGEPKKESISISPSIVVRESA